MYLCPISSVFHVLYLFCIPYTYHVFFLYFYSPVHPCIINLSLHLMTSYPFAFPCGLYDQSDWLNITHTSNQIPLMQVATFLLVAQYHLGKVLLEMCMVIRILLYIVVNFFILGKCSLPIMNYNATIYYQVNVTNITSTGSAMVNWNRRLLIQGVTTVSWC